MTSSYIPNGFLRNVKNHDRQFRATSRTSIQETSALWPFPRFQGMLPLKKDVRVYNSNKNEAISSSPSEQITIYNGEVVGNMLNVNRVCFLSFLGLFSNNLSEKGCTAEKHYSWAALFFCSLFFVWVHC